MCVYVYLCMCVYVCTCARVHVWTCARVYVHVVRCHRCEHITPVLLKLLWFPVKQRVQYLILLLVFRAQHRQAPPYITDLLEQRAMRVLCWAVFYLVDMSLFCWTVYWNSVCDWLQVVCPHFAQHTSIRLFYWLTMSTLENMTCHRSFITYCNWCDKLVATTL